MQEQNHHHPGQRGHRLHHQAVDMGISPEEIISPLEGLETRVYLIEGLVCANCAAKVESRI